MGVHDVLSEFFDREARVDIVYPVLQSAAIRPPLQESDIDQLDLLLQRQRVKDAVERALEKRQRVDDAVEVALGNGDALQLRF